MTQQIFEKNLEGLAIGVVGLGYVGLPLSIEFSRRFKVLGFDIDHGRVNELKNGFDRTKQVEFFDEPALKQNFHVTNDASDLKQCDVYIVTVPTPLNSEQQPDLGPLAAACETVGQVLSTGNVVIFESTIFPGGTEEFCVPIIEKTSGFILNNDFFCGYSPERVNPGDKNRKFQNIQKITSGSSPKASEFVDRLYRCVVTAGTYKAEGIKIAEAAKILENTQRDVNIALMNEFAKVMHAMGLNTNAVLKAAETKWNFMPFQPGLVGGHCIGVDTEYLIHKAKSVGLNPELLIKTRDINEGMPTFLVEELEKALAKVNIDLAVASVLVLGATFKENCNDFRNSKSLSLINELEQRVSHLEFHDPFSENLPETYPKKSLKSLEMAQRFDAIILSVPHDLYKELGIVSIRGMLKNEESVFFDIKGAFPEYEASFCL